MILGDVHGNTPFTTSIVKRAKRHGAKKIIQLGDFGLWSHMEDGVKFLDTVNEQLRRDGVKLYAVGGNHENWIHWNWHLNNSPKDDYGFAMVRTHIRLAPRTHIWRWGDKTFAMAAGGVSIDRDYRLSREKSIGSNMLWWEDEQLTDAEVDAFPERKVDFLFTHDCSNKTPFYNRLKPDYESQIHRQRIDKILSRCAPEFHFHGHMHTKYDWINMINSIVGVHYVQTYGLAHDGEYWNWGILNTENNTFEFCPSTMGD
jgi:predicted phosphodiesterase